MILLIGGYDKAGDPSERRQRREIQEARRLLTQFQERRKRADISRIERGATSPTAKTLQRLTEALDAEVRLVAKAQ